MADPLNAHLQSSSRRRSMIALIFLAGVMILALALTGCQSSTSNAQLQNGKYERNGFSMAFQDGSYSFYGTGAMTLVEKGNYTVEGNKITFTPTWFLFPDDPPCSLFTNYTYKWAFDEKTQQLTLKVIEDDTGDQCSERRFDFTFQPMTLSKGG